jgi:hypothetical protein
MKYLYGNYDPEALSRALKNRQACGFHLGKGLNKQELISESGVLTVHFPNLEAERGTQYKNGIKLLRPNLHICSQV